VDISIIYVHGIWDQLDKVSLKRQYDESLFGVDQGARSQMAYWADIQHPQRGPSGWVEALIKDALHMSLAKNLLARLEEAEREILSSHVDLGGLDPASFRLWAASMLTTIFIPDVAAYFLDQTKRSAMQASFRNLLIPRSAPYIVVAHSLGTVLAYDVLRAATDPGIQIALFVTCGTPLGNPEIQQRLQQPLQIPRCVAAWRNFYDLIDPIAFLPHLGDRFTPAGRIVDTIVENPKCVDLQAGGAHSPSGYLSTRAVREAVLGSGAGAGSGGD